MTRERAVFLDKDGTVVVDIPYNVDPGLMRLAPGAVEGLPLLHRAGYRLVVFTNQSGVARGYFEEQALSAVERRLRALLEEIGAPLDGFYHCPHHPAGVVTRYARHCECRKPAPGLILRAAADLALDPWSSWAVGDILDDVEAGNRAGCRTILVDNGGETEWASGPHRQPHHVARDLAEAAQVITATQRPANLLSARSRA
jgi:histidinol-phosphate phosphatase family protein